MWALDFRNIEILNYHAKKRRASPGCNGKVSNSYHNMGLRMFLVRKDWCIGKRVSKLPSSKHSGLAAYDFSPVPRTKNCKRFSQKDSESWFPNCLHASRVSRLQSTLTILTKDCTLLHTYVLWVFWNGYSAKMSHWQYLTRLNRINKANLNVDRIILHNAT